MHSFILKQKQQPLCITFQTSCSVKHILIESGTFILIKKCFFNANNMKVLFENVSIDGILLFFLRETKLNQKI